MRLFRLLLSALALGLLAMGGKSPQITVRFFAEANSRDGEPFSTPVKLGNPPREAHLQKVPTIHEHHIREIYPFRSADGSWGCAFKLNPSGRLALEVLSTDRRGTTIVGFIGTKRGNHRVHDIIIDRTVADGVITVHHGLTDLIVANLARDFKVIGDAQIPKLPEEKRGWFSRRKPAQGGLPETYAQPPSARAQ